MKEGVHHASQSLDHGPHLAHLDPPEPSGPLILPCGLSLPSHLSVRSTHVRRQKNMFLRRLYSWRPVGRFYAFQKRNGGISVVEEQRNRPFHPNFSGEFLGPIRRSYHSSNMTPGDELIGGSDGGVHVSKRDSNGLMLHFPENEVSGER